MPESPFDDVRALLKGMPTPDPVSGDKVRDALAGMGRDGDFGRLGDAAVWLAQWQGRYPPRIENPTLAMFAGSHGVLDAGVSLSSTGDTRNQVEALKSGTAPLSAIAAQVGANIRVFELAIDHPTPNIAEASAMTEKECVATMAYGFEALEGEPDVLSIGVIGAGIGTVSAAVACALYGGSAEYWVRPGDQFGPEVTRVRAAAVNQALSLHRGHSDDPLDVLARLGGRELAATAGAILAARRQGIPVILDGFATTIAAGVIHAMDPNAISHVLAAHATGRPAHVAALERIGLKPLVELEFQTGAGLGCATAIGLLKTACAPFLAQPETMADPASLS